MRQAALFKRELDDRVNAVKRDELHRYGIPAYWLVVSPIEVQALSEGVVSTEILKQCAMLLKPDILNARQ